MIRTDARLRTAKILLVLNLCFIWGNSMLPGEISGALSDAVKDFILSLLPDRPEGGMGGGLFRKLCHFTEFTLLGACLAWLHGMVKKHAAFAFAWGAAAACMDETIQRFVPDRGPSLEDVGIDTCGVLTGIALLHLGHHILKKRKLTGGNET
jgi:VanZ family protein